MARAFFSHSSKDKPMVERIARQLGRNNVHLDTLTFEAGKNTIEEIFRSLDSTDIFVLFISGPALDSHWVQKEILHAKKRLDRNIIERIFPLIIDKTISHDDPRIPDWIRRPYNIRRLDNEVMILKKVKQFLRESNFKKYSHLREMNELFVGRNEIMGEFERKVINIDNRKPSSIIAYNYFDGIGRKTFLRNALIKTGIIDKWYEPLLIPLDAKESIEDFIYKLNFIQPTPEIFQHDFSSENIDTKICTARDVLKGFVDNGEIIFVVDQGSIVLPNNRLVDWFVKLISDPVFQNQISICLISKFRPNGLVVKKLGNILAFHVDELSVPDTQTFFIRYLGLIKKDMSPTDTKFFLKHLHGIPGQIIYACNLIDSMGIMEAKQYVKDIVEFDELMALSILEFIKGDPLCMQIVIALSKFEIISYSLLNKIFGESEDVNRAIQKLYDLALFSSVSSTYEYVKLNSSVSDYINRSRLELQDIYSDKLKDIAKAAISKPLEFTEDSDYSEFLLSVQSMLSAGQPIPKRYLIPSYILKSMIQEYYKRKYLTVIELATKVLENETNFDSEIIRETRYWLCLAYCRTHNTKVFDELKYFEGSDDDFRKKDYYFLRGFFHRNIDDMLRAEEDFLKVLSIDPNHSRTKRELVNVYLRKREYDKALSWARDNYNRFKTNILHIQAFFSCLIKKDDLTQEDIDVLNELILAAKKSLDKKAAEIQRQMVAEYEYYVEGDADKAVRDLEDALKFNRYNYFAYKALFEIYLIEEMRDRIAKLRAEYRNIEDEIE